MHYLLTFLLTCATPKIDNATKYPWNDFDQQSLNVAKVRCGELYKQSPCVKLFRKWDEKDYTVLCGKEKE